MFYINLPVGIASLVMTQLYIFDPPYLRQGAARIDYWGIGLLALGIGALQIVLDKGQEDDWFSSHLIVTLLPSSRRRSSHSCIRELVARDPIVRPARVQGAHLRIGVFLMTTLGFVLYGSLVLLPIMLQTLLGLSGAAGRASPWRRAGSDRSSACPWSAS